MAAEIIVMATMAATLLLITGVWADLYTYESSR
jgi:hypothetical protein